MPEQAKKSKKQRKVGRNANYCKVYKLTHQRERNKLIRLKKHLIIFADDLVAGEAVEKCKLILGQ